MIFKELNKTKNKCFLMGDFNINLLDSSDNNTLWFTDVMFNSNFYPLINKPIRITSSCASTIDHVWTNVTNTCINSGIITHCVADHLPVMQVSQFGKLKTSSIPVIRSFAQSNLLDFKSLLENIDLNHVTESNDPDKSFSNLYKLVFGQFDKSFPLKQTLTNETINSAWYDRELRRLMFKKDRIYKNISANVMKLLRACIKKSEAIIFIS